MRSESTPGRRACGAQDPTGERAGVLAVLHEDLAVDDRGVVAGRALHVAAGAVREVVHVLRLREPHAVEVDHVDVGERTGPQHPAVGDAEQVRGVRREPPDRLADRHQAAVADPVGEEEGRLARVHDHADVRAGVGQAQDARRVPQHPLDRVEVVVEERPVHQHLAVALVAELRGTPPPTLTPRRAACAAERVVGAEVVARVALGQHVQSRSIGIVGTPSAAAIELRASRRIAHQREPLGEREVPQRPSTQRRRVERRAVHEPEEQADAARRRLGPQARAARVLRVDLGKCLDVDARDLLGLAQTERRRPAGAAG